MEPMRIAPSFWSPVKKSSPRKIDRKEEKKDTGDYTHHELRSQVEEIY